MPMPGILKPTQAGKTLFRSLGYRDNVRLHEAGSFLTKRVYGPFDRPERGQRHTAKGFFAGGNGK